MALWTLDKFVEEEKKRLDAFAANWREKQQTEGRRGWPNRMDDADWVENLQTYGWPQP